MSSLIVKPPDDEHAYEMIEAAVMETSRGRWFLAEYARRHRHAETLSVLEAIERLRNSLGRAVTPAALPYERLQMDIVEMARAIARTERELRAIQPDGTMPSQFAQASDELDRVVLTTEQATTTILAAAEKVQEYAWTLREHSGSVEDCDLLDACATEIYTACGFQDLTAQRIRKVIDTQRFLDKRLKALLEAAGLAEDFHADEKMIEENDEPAPKQRSSDVWMNEENQAEVDHDFDFFVPAAEVEPTMVGADLLDDSPNIDPPHVAPATNTRPGEAPGAADTAKPVENGADPSPLARYDSLSTEERLRAFR